MKVLIWSLCIFANALITTILKRVAFVLDAYFDKASMKYDMAKGKVLVPASGIKIKENNDDDDYYDNDGDDEVSGVKTPRFRGSKVLYMTFSKRATKNLHYMV